MRSMLPLAGNMTKLPRFSASSSFCGGTGGEREEHVKDGRNMEAHQTSLCSCASDNSVSNLFPLSCESMCVFAHVQEGMSCLSSD